MSSSNNNQPNLDWGKLKSRPVVDVNNAERVGSLEDLVLDEASREVIALVYKHGLFGSNHYVPVSAITGVGSDAITIRSKDAVTSEDDTKKLKNLPTISQKVGQGVVTDGGRFVGNVGNVWLQEYPLKVIGYELSEGGLFSKKHTFQVTPEVRYGDKLVIVPDGLVDATSR